MSAEDDDWALRRMVDDPAIIECSSGRLTLDGVTHRVLREVSETSDVRFWSTLCESHRFWLRDGRLTPEHEPYRRYDFSAACVDCMICLPAGG